MKKRRMEDERKRGGGFIVKKFSWNALSLSMEVTNICTCSNFGSK